MLLIVLLAVAAIFAVLFLTRVGGARRYALMRHWPVVVLAGAALLLLLRGQIWPGLAFAGMAFAAYALGPSIRRFFSPAQAPPAGESPEAAEARRTLGVPVNASDDQIRAAYRSKMAQAHPDRGGSNAEAARLTAARDRLLKRKK